MHEGFYTDPEYQNVEPKIACVIPVYLAGNCKKDYGHWIEDKQETILLNLAVHERFTAGVAYDIILVDHSPEPIEKFSNVFDVYDVLRKPNFGYSFGAYLQAWQHYRDKYDFYLFTEDDIAPSKDGWLAEIVLKFLSEENIGAVGNFVEGRSEHESDSDIAWNILQFDRPMMYNFDGAFTFTSSKILKQVELIGGLPVQECQPVTKLPATINEMIFQQPILELGYKITSFADGNYFVVHGSEIFTNDVMHRTGKLAPLLNLNGRRVIPELAELYSQL